MKRACPDCGVYCGRVPGCDGDGGPRRFVPDQFIPAAPPPAAAFIPSDDPTPKPRAPRARPKKKKKT